MLDTPQIFLLIDLNTFFACKPYEWLEFSRVGRCYVPQVVYEELDSWAASRSESMESRIAREFRRLMLESDWELTRSLISTESRPMTRRARLALDVRNSAEDLARSSIGRLVVVVSNDRALIQQVQALNLENLTGIPVSTLLAWSRSKRQPPIVLQHLRSMQTHSLQLLTAGSSRPGISRLESPKSSPRPVYQKSWVDRLLPLLIILGGLAIGWTVAHSLILKNPQTIEQK
ncbi:PIN domain-containing protein [Leptolyngbya sp. NIES-2104]|uniref:PIN domain-containing protein n=1 Tax=Leptolyngbya sp. NIES-2104 TaxID=1552121 RepID=UPI00073F6F7C|nr:PIN domain-containing protein [Leptolyngbya sp. NIES-2104]